MRAWKYGVPLGPKLCVAEGAFELDILWIVLSEFHRSQKQNRLDIIVSRCISGMSVIITDAEPVGGTCLITLHIM